MEEVGLGAIRYLDHQTHCAVELVVDSGGAALDVERCPAGSACPVGRLFDEE